MSEPVYFLKLELENVRCFGEKATLDLSDGNGNWKKWTVILGDNGLGKTTLLQALALFETERRMGPPSSSGLEEMREGPRMQAVVVFFDFYPQIEKIFDFNRSLTLLLSRNVDTLNLVKSDTFEICSETNGNIRTSSISLSDNTDIKVFGYGASRFMSYKTTSEKKSLNSVTLFNNEIKLINAEEWLLDLDYAASKESEIKAFAELKRDQVKQILKDLLPDVEEIRFTTPTKENLKSTVEFQTPFGWITIHQLSLGYKTMVAWMVDLAARMFERYPDSDNPLAEPAIVLVDEIDLHLHPKWQRKIFDYLSEKFPKTQFVVTAHSPLVVQSAPKDANIVVLRKEGNHVIIDNDIKSVRNWRLDQIMSSDLFGETARNPEVEKWLDERTTLLQKQSLTPEEKIKLAELNKKAHGLPTAESETDIEAMEIIRKAAEYLTAEKA